MAVANASIHEHEVQVGDIGLEQLQEVGATAAAAVHWSCRGMTSAQEAVLWKVWEFADQLAQKWADRRPPFDEMSRFLAGPPGKPTGLHLLGLRWGSGHWSAELFVSSGIRPVGGERSLRWTMRLGATVGQPFVEYLITASVGGKRLTVYAHPSRDGGHLLSYTWSLRLARGRKDERERLQSYDADELEPIVLIDNSWEPLALAESVMAQLIDWHYRVANEPRPANHNCPPPAADALEWWLEWLRKISRNPDVGLEQALPVAKRTVRPPTPSAHCMFWRESLKRRSHGLIDQACGLLGISRTTAYTRLRKAERRACDFKSVNQLVDFLRSQAPTRRLPDDERRLIDSLIENGMKPDAARKYTYRARNLPEGERRARLLRTVDRLAATDPSSHGD
jgi:hypothetical protein